MKNSKKFLKSQNGKNMILISIIVIIILMLIGVGCFFVMRREVQPKQNIPVNSQGSKSGEEKNVDKKKGEEKEKEEKEDDYSEVEEYEFEQNNVAFGNFHVETTDDKLIIYGFAGNFLEEDIEKITFKVNGYNQKDVLLGQSTITLSKIESLDTKQFRCTFLQDDKKISKIRIEIDEIVTK